MKLQTFNGGLATRLQPQLLQIDQGVVYDNIDNESAVLTPVNDKLITNIEIERYNKFYVAGDEWLGNDTPTDFLEFQSVMYIADRINRPQKYKDGVYNFLGIDAPSAAPTTTIVSETETLYEITAVNNTSTGDLPAGDLTYLLVNVNDGIYSTPLSIVIYGSTSSNTRAVSEQATAWAWSKYVKLGKTPALRELVTTALRGTRSVNFSDLLGPLADSAIMFRQYDGIWRKLFEFTSKSDTFNDDVEDISANDELDSDKFTSFSGIYQYVYTYYNNNDGTESAPSPVSDELEIEGGSVLVSGLLNSSDPQVTHKRLYRIGQNIAAFTLVVELDASVTSYSDSTRDTELEGTQLESDNYNEAPAGLQFLAESYAMLFGALGPVLRFTPIGTPNAWPEEYSIQFDEDITGIGTVANGILVMTEFRVAIVTGTGPESLAQQPLRGDQGCISHDSVQQMEEGAVIWASADGLCASSGNNVQNITKVALGTIRLDPVDSEVLDEVYYCLNADGSILAWDYRFNTIPKNLTLNVLSIAKSKGELYGWNSGFLYELFKSDDKLTFSYLSPRFIEGSYTEAKTYKKIYVRSEGDITLVIYIDDVAVATHNLSGTDTFVQQPPQDTQRGYSIQFSLKGTGTVHELEFLPGRRANG